MILFGQAHRLTGPWFERRLGQAHTIPVDRWPHVAALTGNEECYLEYLAVSWRHHRPWAGAEQLEARLEAYRSLCAEVATVGILRPVTVVVRPDGNTLVAGGNHRAALAHVLGLELPTEEVPAHRWLACVMAEDPETASWRLSAFLGGRVHVGS